MSYSLPRQSPPILVGQCFLVLLLGVSLYFFLQCRQEKTNLQTAISKLQQQDDQLRYAERVLVQYKDFINKHPFYRQKSTTLTWAQVSETWDALPYEVLLKRLARLYQPDSPFILENFSAELVEKGLDEAGLQDPAEGGDGMNNGSDSGPIQRVFHLQGYFLCPCR